MKIPPDLKWKSTGRTLGEGGQATVIEVYEEGDIGKKLYALKGLSKDKPAKAYKRFIKEIEAIKKIDHPYIIKIMDYSNIESDFQYYVMEYVPNSKSLKKLVEKNENPFFKNTPRSLKFFMKILDALSACESNKIVHRDLSPANILVSDNDEIKIIDFGLCQIADSSKVTLSDEGVGTQYYMAPECESGIESEIAITSDIYSAGKILWTAITNKFAFARENAVFNEKSMYKLFDNEYDTYHLHHVFEKTIRYNSKDRWSTPYLAYKDCEKILHVIKASNTPLELINHLCPTCGFGNPEPFQIANNVYGGSERIHSFRCKYCGFIFHFDYTISRDNLNKRKDFK